MFRINKKVIGLFAFLFLAALGLFFIFFRSGQVYEIENQLANSSQLVQQCSPISGLACANSQRRPLAVVLTEDSVARPLAGLTEADLVFEMPVITNSITRMIAVYVCNSPEEVGSVRSARHDFIPLTMGLDAILAHWGGSHFALDELDNGVMDNLDALPNPFKAFYQKSQLNPPHNGFTSIERLISSAEKLGYRVKNEFEGYFHIDDQANYDSDNRLLKIGYSYPYNVEYQYDAQTNSYLRWRTGLPEIDSNNNQQVRAKNIVVMKVFSKQIEGPDYNDLDLDGKGECQIYQNGNVVDCSWQKSEKDPASKLVFLDKNGEEIPFVSGQIWIELVEPHQEIIWE